MLLKNGTGIVTRVVNNPAKVNWQHINIQQSTRNINEQVNSVN